MEKLPMGAAPGANRKIWDLRIGVVCLTSARQWFFIILYTPIYVL